MYSKVKLAIFACAVLATSLNTFEAIKQREFRLLLLVSPKWSTRTFLINKDIKYLFRLCGKRVIMKSIVVGVVLAVFVALAASSPRGRSDNQGEYCTEYDMKCTFPPVTHEGEAIHNRGAILEDCGCNRSSAQLRCSNELLVHEVKYCRCACKSR